MLNVREQVQMVERNKDCPSLPLLSWKLPVSAKEIDVEKKNRTTVKFLHPISIYICIYFLVKS